MRLGIGSAAAAAAIFAPLGYKGKGTVGVGHLISRTELAADADGVDAGSFIPRHVRQANKDVVA